MNIIGKMRLNRAILYIIEEILFRYLEITSLQEDMELIV